MRLFYPLLATAACVGVWTFESLEVQAFCAGISATTVVCQLNHIIAEHRYNKYLLGIIKGEKA